jgi:hypothetical protein
VNQQADDDPQTLRISIDAKVALNVGEFDRGGKTRNHSKYNPVERTFGWLEQHWNGSLLDTVETVLHFTETLTFKGQQPVVTLVETVYKTGVKLTQQAMAQLEQQIKRLPNLPKWFVEITGKPS